MDLIDSHAHVDVSDFDADREAMLERARAAGVGTMLAIGNGPEVEKLGAAVPTPSSTTGFTPRLEFIRTRPGTRPTRTTRNWSGWRGTRA